MLKERRIGRFEVPVEIINENPDVVRAIMGEVIVLKADVLYHRKAMLYDAICPQFDEADEGVLDLPFYDINVAEDGVTFTRKE